MEIINMFYYMDCLSNNSVSDNFVALILNIPSSILLLIYLTYLFGNKWISETIYVILVLCTLFFCMVLAIGYIYLLGIFILPIFYIIQKYKDKELSIYSSIIFIFLLCIANIITIYYLIESITNNLKELYTNGLSFYS